jgi:hypothetical protein
VKTAVIFLVSVFLCGGAVLSQDVGFASEREMKDYCQSVVSHIQSGDTDAAFGLIKSEWLFDQAEIDSVKEKTVSQLAGLQDRFGSPFSTAEVGVERISDFVIRFTYIVKYDRHILRWLFVFYKPKNVWLLNSFWWDDNISELFRRYS